jgi:hypothetical protein
MNGDSATLLGVGSPGTGVFSARTNLELQNPNQFTSLIGMVYCGGGSTGYGQQSDPPAGYRTIGSAVNSIGTLSAFTLTPFDRVLVDTSFDVNPDPISCRGDLDGDQAVGISDLQPVSVPNVA